MDHDIDVIEEKPGEGQEHEEISQAELRKRIFNIVWPVTMDSILQMLVSFVTTGLVGRLGDLAVSAVGMSSRVTQLPWALFIGISTGTTVLVARAIGAEDKEGARRTAVQAIIISLVIIFILLVVMFVAAEPILRMLNAEGDMLASSMSYLSIALLGLPMMATMQIIGGVARGMGDTRTPMLVSFAVNIINAILGWVMIYGAFGLPEMGINGAALAMVISQTVGAGLAIMYIASKTLSIGLRLGDFKNLSWKESYRILRIGIPSSAESLFWQLASMFMMSLIMTFGTVPMAAHQLGLAAEGVSYMPSNGFGVAATTLIGHSLGAGNPALGRRYFREIVKWGCLLSGSTSLLLFFGGEFLLGLLTDQYEVIVLGAKYLWLMSFTQVPLLLSGIIGGTLRSAGDVRAPMYISAIGMWGIRIPLSYVFGATVTLSLPFINSVWGPFGLEMGIVGVWTAMNCDVITRFVLSCWRYRQLRWDSVKAI